MQKQKKFISKKIFINSIFLKFENVKVKGGIFNKMKYFYKKFDSLDKTL